MKMIDAVIGTAAVTLLPPPAVKSSKSPAVCSFLIIRPGGIGDAVLLVPLINFIKENYPGAHITMLAERRNAGVFSLVPAVAQVYRYDVPAEFMQALKGRYDAVIDTEQWHRLSAVIARLVRAPIKIGFDTNQRRRMFTDAVPYSHDEYESVSFGHLLRSLGMPAASTPFAAPFLTVPVAALQQATRLTAELGDKPYLVMFPGASIAERRWEVERFRVVANAVVRAGYAVVVVGGSEVRQAGDLIAGATGLNLAGMTTLAETAALIDRSKMVISGDSGVLHLAVGLDVPTVSLFGPGIAEKWAPQGERHVVLNLCLPCSPCTRFGSTLPCTTGVHCMTDITPDDVVNAVFLLLQSRQ